MTQVLKVAFVVVVFEADISARTVNRIGREGCERSLQLPHTIELVTVILEMVRGGVLMSPVCYLLRCPHITA
jgi:hypothetical protein